MKKTIKRNRKDMRVYKDENGIHSIVSIFYDNKGNIVGIGDVEMLSGVGLPELKSQLFSMIKATRLDIINDEYLEKNTKKKGK